MCELPCFGCGGEESRSPWEGGFGEQQSVVDWSWVSTFNDVVRAMGWRGRTRCGVEWPLLLILAPSFFPDAPARHPLQHPSPSVYSPVTSSSAMPRGPNLEQGSRSKLGVSQRLLRACPTATVHNLAPERGYKQTGSPRQQCSTSGKHRGGSRVASYAAECPPLCTNIAPEIPSTRREQQQFILQLTQMLKK